MTAPPPVLALVGPTAAGKSELAIRAAERLGAEIVAVDAFTVYRGMDVGTAKPSAAARRDVAHHMVDVLEPTVECTVQWFQAGARAAVDQVRRRGRVALLVGGSGLYFRAVVDPLEFPPTDAAVRQRVLDAVDHDPTRAHDRLRRVDPEAAARMDAGNLRRAVRALEVWELTGRPFSDWRHAWEHHESIYPDLRVIGVDMDRQELADRIERRVADMFDAGLIDECRQLAGMSLSRTACQAIGYGECLAHLRGELRRDEARQRTTVRTRRYATRQRSWFAGDPRIQWSDPSHVVEELLAACTS